MCGAKDFENSSWQEVARAADISEQCSRVTREVFKRRFSADLIFISNVELASINVLAYFGDLIKILQLNFNDYNDCNGKRENNVIKHRRLLHLANENCRKSVVLLTIGKNPCDVNMFDQLKGPFESAESVQISQPTVTVNKDNLRLNKMFPMVRKLELEFESINDPTFIDCELSSLDHLTVGGGLITNKAYESLFESLIKKNAHIKRITLRDPSYRTFQILHKYLNTLEEVQIQGKYQSDPQNEKLSFPNVRKLAINLYLNCHQPAELTFGGQELQELFLYCNQAYIDDEYFETLDRYPQIKVLNANYQLKDGDLTKMIGKFPFLTKSHFTFSNDITSDTIIKFIEKCQKLVEMGFMSYELQHPDEMEKQLKTNIGGKFTIIMKKYEHSTYFEIRSSAAKQVASCAAILLIAIHISRTFFF